MSIKAIDLRRGVAVEYNNKLYVVHDFAKVSKGNWRSFMQVKLKDTQTGSIIEQRFRVDDTLEQAFLDQKPMEYLYSDTTTHYFMDPSNRTNRFGNGGGLGLENRIGGLYRESSDGVCDGGVGGISVIPVVSILRRLASMITRVVERPHSTKLPHSVQDIVAYRSPLGVSHLPGQDIHRCGCLRAPRSPGR